MILFAGDVQDLIIDQFSCLQLDDIVTPIDADLLQQLLYDTGYNPIKTSWLVDGFRNGFDMGYREPLVQTNLSENLPLNVGSPVELWNKLMSEVRVRRVAGPFLNIPYDSYIQSPIGLVPKDEKKTRLIFHLSYDFNKKGQMDPAMRSFNFHTAEEFSTVKYRDLDYAIHTCVCLCKKSNDINDYRDSLHLEKTDLKSTFRLLPGLPSQ